MMPIHDFEDYFRQHFDHFHQHSRPGKAETDSGVNHFLITPIGKVKLLHCPPDQVETDQWSEVHNADVSPASLSKHIATLRQELVAFKPYGSAASSGHAASVTTSLEEEEEEEDDEDQEREKDEEKGEEQKEEEPPRKPKNDVYCMIEFSNQSIRVLEDSCDPPIVTLRRVGDLSKRVSIDWHIVNGSVPSRYASKLEPSSGTVSFDVGETKATIVAPLVYNPGWNTETFYCIKLDPESVGAQRNVVIGRNRTLPIFQVNTDRFPAGAPEKITSFQLLCKFLQHNSMELRLETIVGVGLMMLTGIIFWLGAVTFKFVVDCGASNDLEDTCQGGFVAPLLRDLAAKWEHGPIVVLVAARIVLLIVEQIQDTAFRHLRLAGKAARKLRHSLFNMLMQMSTQARLRFDPGDIPHVMMPTTEDAVNYVWLGFFKLVQKISLLAGSIGFFMQSAYFAESRLAKVSIAVAGPVMLLLVVAFATSVTRKAGERRRRAVVEAEEHWFSLIDMAEHCHHVIEGYQMSEKMAANVDVMHGRINAAWIRVDDHDAMFIWCLKWGFKMVHGIAIITTGMAARQGLLNLGDFVVVNVTLLNFAKTLLDVSALVKEMLNHSASVSKIASVLNCESKRKTLVKRGLGSKIIEENMISLEDVSYHYGSSMCGTLLASSRVWMSLEPGQLVCWPRVENTHIGVNTIFMLLSGHLVPDSGVVKLPSWWRVIYIPITPVLFDGTLMFNFLYGSLETDAPQKEDVRKVWEICREVGFSEDLVGKDNYDVQTAGTALRNRDRVLVSIVRALLHDVDLLLVSSALDVLGESQGLKVLACLRKYVHNRGVASRSPVPDRLRHKKSVIYSTKFPSLQVEGVCDSILKWSDDSND